jgi:hypothetical protein
MARESEELSYYVVSTTTHGKLMTEDATVVEGFVRLMAPIIRVNDTGTGGTKMDVLELWVHGGAVRQMTREAGAIIPAHQADVHTPLAQGDPDGPDAGPA